MAVPGSEFSEFLSYIEKFQQRTTRIVALIPEGKLEHNFGPSRFTPGDLVRHVAGINRYMFAETAAGRPNRYPGHGQSLAQGRDAVLTYHHRLNAESLEIFRSFTPGDFERKCTTPDGTQITVWKWLRAMIEHEAHHRGQLYLMLSEFGIPTPPLFGLTSEEVRERATQGG